MIACPSCGSRLPDHARFCPACGRNTTVPGDRVALAEDSPSRAETIASLAAAASATPSPDGARFVPGHIVAGRFRVVGLLGRGGMGDVYRADDLRLSQPVALKFLPPELAQDPRRLQKFHAEVRMAREVTHPNVCRVHDIGEAEGQVFLSMEYIDGEDLASLLRRIGRVPDDKAIELARQLCAGLAAAHHCGVLHRDLKPGNVMIDGRGRARITDFGLAVVAGEIAAHDVRSGTPAYMAPEQLAGREVTLKSDLYALGLVLYELFTGHRAVQAPPAAGDSRSRTHTPTIDAPSSRLSTIDPAVERTIQHCLEVDPDLRPGSALEVAAALPGGDPLAAALAAGEIPSPELVAATGGVGALRPAAAFGWLALIAVGLTLLVLAQRTQTLLGIVRFEKPPAVLADRARSILALAGHPEEPVDQAFGLETDPAQLRWLKRREPNRRDWSDLAHADANPFGFWYRQSNRTLDPFNNLRVVTPNDPPLHRPGSAAVWLDGRGALTQIVVATPQVESAADSPHPPFDWNVLLREARLDPAALHAVTPRWTPPVYVDQRAAWENASYRDSLPDGVRVEAGSYRGHASYFVVLRPWTVAGRGGIADARPRAQRAGSLLLVVVLAMAMAGSAWLAFRNLGLGRGDRRGATRIAAAAFGLGVCALALQSHAPGNVEAGAGLLFTACGLAMVTAAMLWVFYLALEPTVRRISPQGLVGWTRLIGGRWRDPRVGRDLLIGSAIGAALAGFTQLGRMLPAVFHWPTEPPIDDSLAALVSGTALVSVLLGNLLSATFSAMMMTFFRSMSSLEPRRRWIGVAIFFSFSALFNFLFLVGPAWLRTPIVAVDAALFTLVFFRYGLLAGVACMMWTQWSIPFPTRLGEWWTGAALFGVAWLLAVALFGLLIAVRGRAQPARA